MGKWIYYIFMYNFLLVSELKIYKLEYSIIYQRDTFSF